MKKIDRNLRDAVFYVLCERDGIYHDPVAALFGLNASTISRGKDRVKKQLLTPPDEIQKHIDSLAKLTKQEAWDFAVRLSKNAPPR